MSRLEGLRRCDDTGRCVGVRGGEDMARDSYKYAARRRNKGGPERAELVEEVASNAQHIYLQAGLGCH